jgi:hypothetical protein
MGEDGKEGHILCTFTPLFGLSEVVLDFLVDGRVPDNGVNPEKPYKFVVQCGWDDVPHLSERQKAELLASYPEHEKEARTQGIPSLGSGAIYPYPESHYCVSPFAIPEYWARVYGMDVGWNRTAAVWAAIDPDSNQIYIYSEHYVEKELVPVQASAIKQRGDWILGVVDPKSRDESGPRGESFFNLYQMEGLVLVPADNSVEAGIARVSSLLAAGQIKIFSSCRNLLAEMRTYARDERGRIIKRRDHACDAMRYLVMSGIPLARTEEDVDSYTSDNSRERSGCNPVTGY